MTDFEREELDRAIAISIAEAHEIDKEKGKKVVGKSSGCKFFLVDSYLMIDSFNLFLVKSICDGDCVLLGVWFFYIMRKCSNMHALCI